MVVVDGWVDALDALCCASKGFQHVGKGARTTVNVPKPNDSDRVSTGDASQRNRNKGMFILQTVLDDQANLY